jgi:Iron-containing redox enzyme
VDDLRLPERLRRALHEVDSLDRRSALATLLDVHALHLAPLPTLDGAEHWQHDPRVAALKLRLEAQLLQRLDEPCVGVDDVVAAMQHLAHDELVPPIYDWLAEEATTEELVEFVSYEGGPDADFDDLVAVCQLGLAGLPKLTLAANFWDEMGRGRLDDVHAELHRTLADALQIAEIPLDALPIAALERKALNGLLATNRALQPEMLGSLGLIECQAGPRCRRVVTAMHRLGVPDGALPFYEEHATADPRHGKDWIAGAIAPLAGAHPEWGPRMLTGATWRATVNRRFFAAMEQHFGLVQRAA